jgi:UDP-GlcNAc:undecaprenyl-phosphate GlcNAc-1-phosphate transferase
VHALPFAFALLAALLMAPALLRTLTDNGHLKPNYRDRPIAFPFGVLSVVGALVAFIPLAILERLDGGGVFHPETLTVAVYVLGVAFLGLLDDTLGGEPRGWRGHGAALLRMQLSTGVLKAAGSLGLALYALGFAGLSTGRWLLASGVLVLATNVFNLLDLRPGRSTKVFILLGAGLTIGADSLRSLWAVGLFAGPALIAGAYDLRERAMLGDTGANLLGAVAGLWLVLTLSPTGQGVALVLLAIATVYGELRSISKLVERTPLLRGLDSWGAPR